jgi:hypothetical protein
LPSAASGTRAAVDSLDALENWWPN